MLEHFVGKRLEPAQQHGFLSAAAHFWHYPFDQVRRSLEILTSQSVVNRICCITILLVPCACPPVQTRYLIGLLRHQVNTEDIGKKVVIAIPVAPVIQRDDKEVAPLQGFQPFASSRLSGDHITQWTAQAVEDGGLEQKTANGFGLAPQDLGLDALSVSPTAMLRRCECVSGVGGGAVS